jgi:hypothetical protein
MKKLMKHFLLLAITGCLLVSCGTDDCSDVICGANGTCTNGVCVCDPGFEKDANGTCVLSVSANAKFIGFWDAVDSCSNGNSPFSCEIKEFPGDPNKLKISGFWGFFTGDVNVTLSNNNNTLNIASQKPDADETYVRGTGTYNTSTGKINWNYVIEDRNTPNIIDSTTCRSVWTKR